MKAPLENGDGIRREVKSGSAESGHNVDIQKYYSQTGAGPDYFDWSVSGNMHFGFWRAGLNPLDREAMLEETNRQVLSRLCEGDSIEGDILDLGCGLGATLRSGAKNYPDRCFEGLTLVPWQIEKGEELSASTPGSDRIKFSLGSFENSPYKDASFAGTYAIEAAVHAEGDDKRNILREAKRILMPGGKLVIYDCFLKKPVEKMAPWVRWAYNHACRGWAVKEMPNLEKFCSALKSEGFEISECKDTSWRVAPSVAHVPWVTLKFLAKKLLRGQAFNEVSRRHVLACTMACLLGLARPTFSYFLICARKPKAVEKA